MKNPFVFSSGASLILAGFVASGCGGPAPEKSAPAEKPPAAEAAPAAPAAPVAAEATGGVLTTLPAMAAEAIEAVAAAKGDQTKIAAIKQELIDKSTAVIGAGVAVPVEQQGHLEDFVVVDAKVTKVQWRPGDPPFLNVSLTVKGKKESGDLTVPCDFVDADGKVLDTVNFYLPTGGRLFVDAEKVLEGYQTYKYSTYLKLAKLVVK